jgi:DNA-binding beta-propeller fold protein YncE
MNSKRHFEETLQMFAEYTAAASTTAHASRNRLAMTDIPNVLLAFAITLLGLAAVALVYLVYPGTPSESKVMTFEGFIELPRGGLLTVLDYLTLNDQTLFVTSESSGAMLKIAFDPSDLKASTVSEMPGAGAAHGVAVLPDVDVAFITRSEANTVDVFDPKSLHQLASIPVADDPDAILYIPSTNLIYVAHGDPNMATLIDPQRRTTVGTIQLSGKPESSAMDSESGLLFQNLKDTNEVAAIDVGKRSVVGQWPLAPCVGPSGMAIHSEKRRLFTACSGNAKLVVFDLERHRVITWLGIGGGPDSVAFDPGLHRIYTAGKVGEMTVIQQDGPDNYRVLDKIHTHYGAHTLTADPVSHKVFVAYASLLAHPRIAVFCPTPTAPEVHVAPVIQQDVHEDQQSRLSPVRANH